MRISAHHLAIETGRYTQPKTPIEKRHCFYCSQEIEDEFHLIFKCKLYQEERSTFSEKLSSFSNIILNPSDDVFHMLMSCMQGDLEVGRALCEFVNSSFERRSKKIGEIKEREKYLRPIQTITKSGRISKRPTPLNL